MDIKTLESFRLGDAIFFHDELNNNLWDENNQLRPEVKKQLLIIAKDFIEELGIKDLDVKDITVSGSNAAYTYTPHSDLDLHILVDMSKLPENEVYRELFTAKKNLYNDSHDITVHGVPVELYVQDSAEPVVSIGEYSILKDKWLRIPTKRRANFDQTITKQKYDKLHDIIKKALKSKNLEKVNNIITTIKRYRKAGLDKGGEFGPENLAYKALRTQGYIDKLYDLRNKLHSDDLSIEEGIFYSDPTQLIDLYLRKVDSHNLGKTTLTKILQGLPYGNLDKTLELISKKHNINPTDVVWQPSSKTNEDYDPNGPPPGPEFKPTMPAGTVRVDVSDVYDWYKLGQHISNMKGLGKHDFGKGPPSTIMSFGSEPEEHKYINYLEKTGLTTTDIDPVDVNQPKGMKRQKVDPTYNVNEKINPEIIKSNFKAEKTIDVRGVGPVKLVATNITTNPPQQFRVDVKKQDGGHIGYFRFVVHGYEPEPKFKMFSMFKKKNDPYLAAGNAVVWDDYQKKGIATEVYKWIKSMGNDIRPSPYQSDAGKAMWRGFEKNKVVDEVLNTKPGKKNDAYWEHEGEDGSTLHFETKDGYEYELSFIPPWMGADEVKSYDFADVTDEQDDAGRYVEFVQKDPDDWMGGEKGVTGTGSSAEVFGIVVNGILQYVKKYKPPFLMFQAAEVNRRSLYNAMLQRLLPSIPNYKVIGPRADGAYFVYDSRVIKPKVSEEEKPKQGAKSAIYSTDVYGMTAYHSKCLEPGCDWESKRYDSIKLAQNAAQKHAQKHFKQGVAEAFDQPYPIKWEKSDFGDHDALATLSDGTPLTIMFNGEPKNNWVVDFHRNNSQDVTGEGDAQRVFATVLAAIHQFIIKKKPNGLTFHSIKDADPKGTRTRLYDRLVQRYIQGTGYQLNRVQQPGQIIYKLTRIQNVKENVSQTTLNQLYDEMPDRDEMIWNFVGQSDFDTPFTVETINPNKLKLYFLSQYRVEHIDEITDLMDTEQKKIVNRYIKDSQLSNKIIVMADGKVIDGQHRAMAAILSNRPIKYIDVAEETLNEGASGYIPSNAQKNDPRFKTALTVDIKPDTMKKDAKKFGNKISRAGIPPTLKASGKF